MFSIIISEKGGAERRESYDKTEINVGRVQGNDLMLPKGNVSKRHARLLFRDGRFIVTDLKSTNGTYVNGRKIAQATIVREGDKIYIGDFVLRIELANDGQSAGEAQPQLVADESSEGVIAAAPQGGANFQRASGVAPPPLPGAPTAGPPPMPIPVAGPQVPPAPMVPAAPPTPGPGAPPARADGIPAAARETALGPGPAAPPGGFQPQPAPYQGGPIAAPAPVPTSQAAMPPAPSMQHADDPHGSPTGAPPAPPAMVAPPAYVPPGPTPSAPGQSRPDLHAISSSPAISSAPLTAPPGAKVSAPPPASIPSSVPIASPRSGSGMRSAAASQDVVDAGQAAQHRAALGVLMERATQAVDTASLMSGQAPSSALVGALERALTEKASAMRSAGELPAGVEPEVLVAEARRELFELGPIGPLLDDEYVEEVQVIRHDHVVALAGKKQVATEIAFTSEAAVARLVRRLCVRAGKPLGDGEVFVDRRLERGARLFGVLPPASGESHMLVMRKPQRALATLDELVRNGTLSRGMASLLAQAVQGRANILVTGGSNSGASTLLGALAGAGNIDDRVVVLQEDDELIFNQPHTISMLIGDTATEGARAVHAAIRVRPDRLVVGAFAGHVVAEVVDAIGDGVDGVLAAARAPTLRHLVARLPADLAATKRMLALDTAREWLASSFDLVVEVARMRDGRQRVMRLTEFSLDPGAPLGQRDIFTFAAERTAAGGALEGTFHASGVVPRIAEDLAARGVPVDMAIFKRASR